MVSGKMLAQSRAPKNDQNRVCNLPIRFKLEQLPMDEGIVPVKLFPYSSMFSRFTKKPISVGMGPEIVALDNISSLRLVSFPTLVAMLPENTFKLKYNFSKFVSR